MFIEEALRSAEAVLFFLVPFIFSFPSISGSLIVS